MNIHLSCTVKGLTSAHHLAPSTCVRNPAPLKWSAGEERMSCGCIHSTFFTCNSGPTSANAWMHLVVFHLPQVRLGKEIPGGVGKCLEVASEPIQTVPSVWDNHWLTQQVLLEHFCLVAGGAGHELLKDRISLSTCTYGLWNKPCLLMRRNVAGLLWSKPGFCLLRLYCSFQVLATERDWLLILH